MPDIKLDPTLTVGNILVVLSIIVGGISAAATVAWWAAKIEARIERMDDRVTFVEAVARINKDVTDRQLGQIQGSLKRIEARVMLPGEKTEEVRSR